MRAEPPPISQSSSPSAHARYHPVDLGDHVLDRVRPRRRFMEYLEGLLESFPVRRNPGRWTVAYKIGSDKLVDDRDVRSTVERPGDCWRR